MRSTLQTIVFIIFSLGFLGCNYSTKNAELPTVLTEEKLDQLMLESNYQSVNAKVISGQCLNCHSEATGNKGKLNLETYENIRANLNQIMYRVLEVKDMPEGGLNETDFALMDMWLTSGAPEKNTQSVMPSLKGPFNWIVIRDQVLKSNCLDCHSSVSPEAGLDLSDYDQFVNNYAKIFDRTFVKQDMPPEPYDGLSANEKQAVLKWISQGFPK
jgi:uncharacterized membrane protein